MYQGPGRVVELRLDIDGAVQAWVDCPPAALPPAGQYLLAQAEGDVLPTPLFLERRLERGFLAASAAPRNWSPGELLWLRGPQGRGFHPPAGCKRVGLVGMGEGLGRLISLLETCQPGGITVYFDGSLPDLPAAVEALPLNAVEEGLAWVDYLAVDAPLERLSKLRPMLGLPPGDPLPCPAQALVWTGMPCGGVGECGACAVRGRLGWKLACSQGPVFDLDELDW